MSNRLKKTEINTLKIASTVEMVEAKTEGLGVECYKILLNSYWLCSPEYLTQGALLRAVGRIRPDIDVTFKL